ncbi:hypothetical protein CPB84DRAFT_263042 [Gymnopilus junonius]|uniref:Uncharacterized protein n=1 Tax=Gymnopilus junonius TaxID=109634 RepID=A0A9P5NEE5_GYMJU|nr:hypothetical protein CPB84DRAFT_263042 [Gymnopilus junonius]
MGSARWGGRMSDCMHSNRQPRVPPSLRRLPLLFPTILTIPISYEAIDGITVPVLPSQLGCQGLPSCFIRLMRMWTTLQSGMMAAVEKVDIRTLPPRRPSGLVVVNSLFDLSSSSLSPLPEGRVHALLIIFLHLLFVSFAFSMILRGRSRTGFLLLYFVSRIHFFHSNP